MVHIDISEWAQLQGHILALENAGLLTRTFRRLDPERQSAVLLAILEEAGEKGPAAIHIKQVAARAGVSVGSLYQYFGDRATLLAFAVELCGRYMQDLFSGYQEILAAMPLRDGLIAYLAGGVEWSRLQAGLLQFFLKAAYQGDPELSRQLVQPVAEALRATVGAMLSAARARGELRPDLDLETATRLVHVLTLAVGDSFLLPALQPYFQTAPADTPPEDVFAATADFILRGIGRGD